MADTVGFQVVFIVSSYRTWLVLSGMYSVKESHFLAQFAASGIHVAKFWLMRSRLKSPGKAPQHKHHHFLLSL